MTWNPNDTATLGLEWRPTKSGLFVLESASAPAHEVFFSSGSATVTAAEVYLDNPAGSHVLELDLIQSGNVLSAGDGAYEDLYPRTDTGKVVDTWLDQGLAAASYADVNDKADSGFVLNQLANDDVSPVLWRMGAGGPANFTGKRVTRVELYARWKYAGGRVTARAALGDGAGGYTRVGGNVVPPRTDDFRSERIARWDLNPLTGRPWTLAEANAYLSSASTKELGLCFNFATLAGAIEISALWARVQYVTENRDAFGFYDSATDPAPGPGWKSIPLAKPDGTSNWAKTNGVTYHAGLRRIGGTGRASWPYIEAATWAPNANHRSYEPVLHTDGRVRDLGAELNRVHPIRLIVSGSDNVDSQPYVTLTGVASLGDDVGELIDPASASYGFVRAIVRIDDTVDGPVVDPLYVAVVRVSDDHVMGSTTIPRTDIDALEDLGDGWRELTVNLTAFALVSGTKYRVVVNCNETYELAVVDTIGKGAQSHDGTTNDAVAHGGTLTGADAVITLSTVPTAPSGFSTTAH